MQGLLGRPTKASSSQCKNRELTACGLSGLCMSAGGTLNHARSEESTSRTLSCLRNRSIVLQRQVLLKAGLASSCSLQGSQGGLCPWTLCTGPRPTPRRHSESAAAVRGLHGLQVACLRLAKTEPSCSENKKCSRVASSRSSPWQRFCESSSHSQWQAG